MKRPLCDFYDWTSHRTCERPAAWVTHQTALGVPRPHYYCDAHRPPRAHPVAARAARRGAARPDARKRR